MMTGYQIDNNVYTETFLDKNIVNLINEYQNDAEELAYALMGCQLLLENNTERINELLEKRGLFRRLFYAISGQKSKNKKWIMKNLHEIQRISFEIQKLLYKKILNNEKNIDYLNKVIKNEILDRKRIDDRILRLQLFFGKKLELNEWVISIRSQITENNEAYIDISPNRQILYFLSDAYNLTVCGFDILTDRNTDALLKTAFKNIELTDKKINVKEFYDALIEQDGENLWLFVKEDMDFEQIRDQASSYGRLLYDIGNFLQYTSIESPLLCDQDNPSEVCRGLCSSLVEKSLRTCEICEEINAQDLCELLFEDMKKAHRQEMENLKALENREIIERRIEEVPQEETALYIATPEYSCTRKSDGNSETNKNPGKKKKYAISKADITDIIQKINTENDHVKKFLIAPQSILANKVETDCCKVLLPDYMALLWLTDSDNKEKRKNANLAVVDYYEKKLWLYGYRTDIEGEYFYRTISGKELSAGKGQGTIENAIYGMFGSVRNIVILTAFSKDDAGKKIRRASEMDFAEWIAAHTSSFWDDDKDSAIEKLEELQYQRKIRLS